jgi:hypothetical protein
VRYVGSPYQTCMAEAGEAKALLVLDSQAGWVVAEEVPIPPEVLGARRHFKAASVAELASALPSWGLKPGDRVQVLLEELGAGGAGRQQRSVQRASERIPAGVWPRNLDCHSLTI